jgi:ribonucleotide reductase alpha subunit
MQRVANDGVWTLFSPDETPDLHDLTSKAFAERYVFYEAKAARGEMRVTKQVRAVDLCRRILTRLFETGHPWITLTRATYARRNSIAASCVRRTSAPRLRSIRRTRRSRSAI